MFDRQNKRLVIMIEVNHLEEHKKSDSRSIDIPGPNEDYKFFLIFVGVHLEKEGRKNTGTDPLKTYINFFVHEISISGTKVRIISVCNISELVL